jgi:hypothetical protein
MESASGEASLFAREGRETSDIVNRCFGRIWSRRKHSEEMLFDTKWLYASFNPHSAITIGDGGTANLAAFASALGASVAAVRGMRNLNKSPMNQRSGPEILCRHDKGTRCVNYSW